MIPDTSRRGMVLAGLIALQGLCALFYLIDVLQDVGEADRGAHTVLEFVMTGALVLGVGAMSLQLRDVMREQRRIERQLKLASGAFAEVLLQHFDGWRLTPAERDVALLSLKGLSIAEIAAIRETRDGTVKAQLNRVYGKAGVTGRLQLLAIFIETLMGEGIVAAPGEPIS